jgi:hypothetical protein
MGMFDFGEFCFVQRGACRHKAAGTDGIDGPILVFSMRKRLIRTHATTPTTSLERPNARHSSNFWEAKSSAGRHSSNFSWASQSGETRNAARLVLSIPLTR